MKQLIATILAALLAIGSLAGCNNKNNSGANSGTGSSNPSAIANSDTTNLTERIGTIENQAKTDVENLTEVTKDNVQEAIHYIDTHIADPFQDTTVTEKLAYYGAYLKHLGSKAAGGAEHDISIFGNNVHQYIKGVYTKTEQESSEATTKLKNSISSGMESIKNESGKLVDDFVALFQK